MQRTPRPSLSVASVLAVFAMTACAEVDVGVPKPGSEGSLEWAVAGTWRTPADTARDSVRKPVEELSFMGVKPYYSIVEIYPGGGYFTSILAPYVAKAGGTLTAIGGRAEPGKAFKEKFLDHPEIYGKILYGALNDKSGPMVKDGTADIVLTFRNVHNWMEGGYAEKAFKDFYAALKPGGILGLEEHRAKPTGPQDPKAKSGYVQEAYVKKLAADAGFEFVKSSELLANPKDTADHPFGVWTLPPTLQSTPDGKGDDPKWDKAKYKAIGEADNMLLVFRKPAK